MTLAELLVVVAVIAVAAGVVLADGGAWEPQRLEAAGRVLAEDLRYARGRAVATGRPHTVTVNHAAGVYEIADAGGGRVPDPRRPGRGGPLVRDLAELFGGGVRLERPRAAPGGAAVDAVTFTPEGTLGGGHDVTFWAQAPGGPNGGDWRLVRARIAAATGQVWADGPHPQNGNAAAVLAVLLEGEAPLAAP